MADILTVDAVVIGAGSAGLAAAVRLSGAGATVAVVEQAPRLGGRTTSFVDRDSGERIDNGQHVLFGCYRETYAFLAETGAAELAPLARTLSLTIAGGPEGRRHTLTCPDLPSPWHLAVGLMLWDAVPFAERLALRHLEPLFDAVRVEGAEAASLRVDSSLTVTGWLDAQHQGPELRRWLWHPLVYAALNQGPDAAAARPFVRVLAEMFGPRPEDSAIGLPTVPLDDLIAAPAIRLVESRGGTLLSRRPAKIVTGGERLQHVKVGDTLVRAGIVVSAVPWHAFHALWDEMPPRSLAEVSANATAMKASPIVTVNLWFDRDVMGGHQVIGLADGTMHWFFGRQAITGQGAHVSSVTSGAADILRLKNDEIVARALADARRALPSAERATLVRAVVVREPRAGFSLAPDAPDRPGPITPLHGFFIAGDWTDTGLPATIEGAVKSGHAAASAVLALRP